MKSKLFESLQRCGRAFMLPIAILPVAGLLLGIGSSFTNATTLEAYRLTGVIYEGGVLYTILSIMKATGSVVFDNLPLLFAVGVAIGMAKQEKEVAALAGVLAYLIMNASISALIFATGGVEALAANTTASVLGITTLQMGVFGGIIVGLGVAALHNRFYKIELPQVFSFFGGTRFVPIICSLVYLLVGILMFFIWPIVQRGIASLGNLVLASGYAGTWIYGIIERALIPFGLHHVFYTPFWQTELGGSMIINGTLVQGAQNIYFAQLADPNTTRFSVEATRFMAGKFPFMIFGLPAAAYAIYRCAKPEKRQVAGGLLLSAAITSMLTGITEPLEFTFLFVAPLMYGVHCVLAGLSFMLMHIFNVGVGMTFSGGIIDLILFGVLQGNAKTNWIWVIIVGLVFAVIYYFVFSFMIRKFNYKTPGREDDGEETKLYTRKDVNARKENNAVSELILKGLGGKENISDIDACATRLRVTVKNGEKVSESALKESGASGVIKKGNGVQVVYGPRVSVIKSNLMSYMEMASEASDESGIISSPMNGKIVKLGDVPDEAFSGKVLGDGVAIEPSEGKLYAPFDGKVEMVFDTKHAINLISDDGCELLMHIGIDTVSLKGKYFETHVSAGDRVKKGDLLISFDVDGIKKEGFKTVTPIVVCNHEDYKGIKVIDSGNVKTGDKLIEIMR